MLSTAGILIISISSCHIVIMSRSDSLLRHYIANAWLAKLDTVAEPGPIDNSSVICQHGGVRFNRHIVYILEVHNNVPFFKSGHSGCPLHCSPS